MKPPADRRLDMNGTGVDVPAPTRPRYGVRWSVVLAVATMLSAISSLLAFQAAASASGNLNRPATLVLNVGYWFTWALLTPPLVWLAQHFRFERPRLHCPIAVHLPGVALFSLTHLAVMTTMQWWLAMAAGRTFAWNANFLTSVLQNLPSEIITYSAIAALGHAVLYYRESRDRAARGAELEAQLVEVRMAILQQQLQPHFLFNTLHAISALMHRDVEAADRTLTRLSDLLRMTLEHASQQEITLQTELDFLAKYLEIEQTRFADRLVIRFDVAADTLDTLLPSLLLQPLVENAIKHGVSRKAGPGHVTITTRRDHDMLWIEIRDDGAGLSESALSALQKGIGVSTTRARLQHQFGADFRFEFHRQEPGVAVVVAVPWRLDQRSAEAMITPGPTPASPVRFDPTHGSRLERSELAPQQPA